MAILCWLFYVAIFYICVYTHIAKQPKFINSYLEPLLKIETLSMLYNYERSKK